MHRNNYNKTIIRLTHVKKPQAISNSGAETIRLGKEWNGFLLYYEIAAFVQDYLNASISFVNASNWYDTDGVGGLKSMKHLLDADEADLAFDEVVQFVPKDSLPRYLFPTRYIGDLHAYVHNIGKTSDGGRTDDIMNSYIQTELFLFVFTFLLVLHLIGYYFFKVKSKSLFVYPIAIITRQEAFPLTVKMNCSQQIFYGLTSIFGILLSTLYSASLVSNLAVNEDIINLEALVQRGYTLTFGNEEWLENSNVPLTGSPLSFIHYIPKLKKYNGDSEDEATEEFLLSPRRIFVVNKNLFSQYEKMFEGKPGICDRIQRKTYPAVRRLASSFVNPDSKFANDFNLAFLTMFEKGIGRKMLRMYHEGGICQKDKLRKNVSHEVSINSLQKVILLLIGGFGFSICGLAFEKLVVIVSLILYNFPMFKNSII